MEEAGAVGFTVAGAMLLAMALEGGKELETLKTMIGTPPNTWVSQAATLSWMGKLFGISIATAIVSFVSAKAATAFAGICIAWWVATGLGKLHATTPTSPAAQPSPSPSPSPSTGTITQPAPVSANTGAN